MAGSVVIPPDLPGADLVIAGLDDLAAGRLTVAACLASHAPQRLRRYGVDVPAYPGDDPEDDLYALLDTR